MKRLNHRAGNADGFTLVEVMLALFLIGIGVLAAAPMFMYAIQGNAVGADLGSIGAIGVERLELLRSTDYTALPDGGDLTADTTGYFDNSDPAYSVRWRITSNVTPIGTKTIEVRVAANRQVVGNPKQVLLSTLRGR